MSIAVSAPSRTAKPWLAALITSVLFLIVCLSWGTTWLSIKLPLKACRR